MKKNHSAVRRMIKIGLLTTVVAGVFNLAVYRYVWRNPNSLGFLMSRSERLRRNGTGFQAGTGYAANYRKTDEGRDLLWAQGPKNLDEGEWFDVTGSPLDPEFYGNGIGKDQIPAIDDPEFASARDQETLRARNIHDNTTIIGYVHNGDARAYPIDILHYHELVNDEIGGKPVTVGW